MHTLGLSTAYFLIPWNLGWLYNSHSGRAHQECPHPGGLKNADVWTPASPPTHCPRSPYTKRSPKGSGVFTVESEKPRVQGKAGDFAELLRASVLHSSSAWGLWAQRRDRQQSQKAFLQRAAQTRHARLRDGRHVRRQNPVLLTYMSTECELEHHGINSSLSENKRLHIWGRVCL